MAAIADFETDVAASKMDAFIVVTTRPQGYSDDLSPRFYRHRMLTPLRPALAVAYGGKLTKLRYGSDPNRANRITERLRLAAEHESTSRLMQSPLQVTIMTFLVDQLGRPPEERWGLFHEYYELICKREVERNISSSVVIREHRSDIDATHRTYGLLLQSESERSGGTRSRLAIERFEELVSRILFLEEYTEDRLADLLAEIKNAAANRLVFLVGLEEGQVGFEIRSLQEFMAGEAVLWCR